MKTIELKVYKREKVGKSDSRKLRRQGNVPCVIYGGKEVIHCYTSEKALKDLIYTPEVFLINIDVDGEKKLQAIKKEVQFHPVSDRPIHVDFLEVYPDRPVKVNMPVKLKGFAKGVQAGGQLYQLKRYLKVKGLVKHIPEHLEVDVTDLGLGKSIKISDIKFENLEIMEPASAVVALVKLTRAAISRMQEEAKQNK